MVNEMQGIRQGTLFDANAVLERAAFSGHESFPFRYTWLYKGVAYCHQNPDIFGQEDAMAVLGVGKNMVKSIRHWCIATKMLEEMPHHSGKRSQQLQPSELGTAIFLGKEAWDPYLEDIGTLWLIHYLLATNPDKATTWYVAFNHIHFDGFTKESLEGSILEFLRSRKLPTPSKGTLKRDIDVFIRTYLPGKVSGKTGIEDAYDCPLIELGIIRQSAEQGTYTFNRGTQETLPDGIFAFCLSEFIRSTAPGRKTITFDELAYAPFSPGKVFKLSETSLSERLDRIESLSRGAWVYGETAGLKQLYITDDVKPISLLKSHYLQQASIGWES